MKEKFKIVHLITRLDAGGSAESTFLLARKCRRRGHDAAIWAGTGFDLPRDIEKEAAEAGVPILFLPSLTRSIRPWKDLRALFDLTRRLRREKPDLVHTHTSKAGFLGRLAARLAGVPVVVHTPHGHVFYGYFGPLKTAFYIGLERLAARWSDAIVPLTQRGAEEHLERRIGKKEQYCPIPDGIDFSLLGEEAGLRREKRRRLGIPESATVIGAPGRFVPIKGFDLAVAAAFQVLREKPEVYFYLAGVGPLREKLERQVQKQGLGKKILFDDFQEVRGPLHLLDIFLLPSRNEGLSRTLLQAMALKKGIVACAVGGVPDAIRDGETGRLVPPDDPAALARAILDLLEHPDQMKRMGEKAAAEVRRRFTLQGMVDQYEALYRRLWSRIKNEKA